MKFALVALFAAVSAVRFSDADLSAQEEEALARPALMAERVLTGAGGDNRRSFSQGLEEITTGKAHWDTEFRAGADELKSVSAAPVIQPSEDALDKREQMALVKQANEELAIRHTAPLPDAVAAADRPQAPVKSPKQKLFEAEQHNKMFAKYVDDKDMGDSRITSKMLDVVGV